MSTIAIPTPACNTLIADLYGTADQAAFPQPPAPEPLPEAAFSLTIKGTIGGHEAMLTVRAQTAQAFAANVAAVRGMLDAASATRHAPLEPPPPAAPASPDGWCAVHNVPMAKQANARGSWFSHKTADGWCKGK